MPNNKRSNHSYLFCSAGEGGIGKSSSLALLAMDWVEGNNLLLQQFDCVFLIQLRHVSSDDPLEEEIIKQHTRLNVKRISPTHIRAMLEGDTEGKVLLLIDGYDEYKIGTNSEIEYAIKNSIGECFIILTSRPGGHIDSIRRFMKGEVKIVGLSDENIKKCAMMFLNDEEMCERMLIQAGRASRWRRMDNTIYDLLRIPILLLMVCQIFKENKSLPSSKTQTIDTMIKLSMSRTTMKTLGKKADDIDDLDKLLCLLGELAWGALKRDSQELLIKRVTSIFTTLVGLKACHGLPESFRLTYLIRK